MKVTVVFKTPDAVSRAVRAAVEDEIERMKEAGDEMASFLREELFELASEKVGAFFANGEYCEVEFDIISDTATVIRPSRRR